MRTALVGVCTYPHHGQPFDARTPRLTVTALRGIDGEVLSRAVPLPGGSLDEIAVPPAARMRQLVDAGKKPLRGCALTVTVSVPRGLPPRTPR